MKTIKQFVQFNVFAIACLASFLLFFSCSEEDNLAEPTKNETPADSDEKSEKVPKYIFYFIGDGVGSPQINIAEAASFSSDFGLKSSSIGLGSLNYQKFTTLGMQTTHALDRYVTGSAASATALATGYKTTINTISMNADHDEAYETMAEMAKKKGMKVGIISSVSIDHATPACFYAHSDTRNWYNFIANQMASSNFDYFAGGFAKGDFDKYKDISTPGKRVPANFTPVDVLSTMKSAGYSIATTAAELDAIQVGTKCWTYSDQYDGSGALPYEIDRETSDISLADFTQRGIEIMDNDAGFFMMVEGGKIDWACHANDAVSASIDMLAFDAAIGKALDFYEQHKEETLIVITGDHECGGLTLGYAATKYETAFTLLNYQKMSYDNFISTVVSTWTSSTTIEEALLAVKENFGLGDENLTEQSVRNPEQITSLALTDYEIQRLTDALKATLNGNDETISDDEKAVIYGSYDPFTVTVTHILNQKAGIDWSSYSHTGVPVPVYAKGVGETTFNGYYDNTDVAKKIIEVGDLNSTSSTD